MIVDFEPVGRRVEGKIGQSILEIARSGGLQLGAGGVTAPCGGKGICGRCRVRVDDRALLSPPSSSEQRHLTPSQLAEGYRLACQAVLLQEGAFKVVIPPETMLGVQKLQVEGTAVEVDVDPPLRHFPVIFRETSLTNPKPALEQARDALVRDYSLPGAEEFRVDLGGVATAAPLAQAGCGSVAIRDREIIGLHVPGSRGAGDLPPLGLAVDLGTTKIAGFLLDLETGATLAAAGMMNPQIGYGEDVMARLGYALEGGEKFKAIRQAVIDGLNELVRQLLELAITGQAEERLAGRTPAELAGLIEEGVIVGNTAMHHLLLGLPVGQLARAPYVPALCAPLEVKARELGLEVAPGAWVYLAPVIAGFVGADHVAMILGSRIEEMVKEIKANDPPGSSGRQGRGGVIMGMDIGTNTEIVLAWPQQRVETLTVKMLACSCASGPAFEGAHVAHGMRAVTGAVESVALSDGGRTVTWDTIGNAPPLGICGSGILDVVAELYRTGVINRRGRFRKDHPRVRRSRESGQLEYLLVPAAESGTGEDLVVTQHDISEIQLAKAAIATGASLLMETAGVKEEELARVVVAGAFGTHLRLESAITLGMLPGLPLSRYFQVGNAAGTGARLLLLSRAERRRAEETARRVDYVELMLVPSFRDTFISALNFPETVPTIRL